MSSTGDELSDSESQAPSIADGEARGSSVVPTSAQLGTEIPSSPPAQAGAARDALDPEDEGSESESDRENRFDGPASTWRSYTLDERQLIASLDQQRANDLSIHLYNAHALKARLYDPEASSLAIPWSSKRSWIKLDEAGNVPWHPDRNWTAWPMPPEEVPRKEEVFGVPPTDSGDQESTYRKSEPWTPSVDMQEEVQALMLRKAKERFRQRKWTAMEDRVDHHSPPDTSGESPEVEAGTVRSPSDVPEDVSILQTDKKPSIAPERKYSQPSFLADDDRANAILQPSVRHILAKFDDLLIGLHKSRQGHRRPASASRSRSRASAPRSRSRSAAPVVSTRARVRSKGKQKAMASDDDNSNYSPGDESAVSDQAETSPSKVKKKRRPSGANNHELGLRDWGEVLGIASLVGWDQAVVDRTAQRCASLFGESNPFLTQSLASVVLTDDHTVRYVFDTVSVESDMESEEPAPVPPQAQQGLAWFCPYQDCGRHIKAFEKGWRWREHLRRTHKSSVEQVEEVELARGNQDPDAGEDAGGDDEGSNDDEEEGEGMLLGGIHRDGFLEPVTIKLERGRDVRPRRRRSTNERKGSKRRRLEADKEMDAS